MGKRALSSVLLGLALAGLAILAAGCGSSSAAPPAATTTRTGGPGANSAAFQAYQACLKSHGVSFSFPRGGRPPGGQAGAPPTGTPPTSRPQGANGRPPAGFGQLTAKQRAAMTACQSKLPAGARNRAPGPDGGTNGGQANAAFKKYTACLKSHGVTFGTASASGTKFAKAAAACKNLLPTTGGATP